MNGARKTSSQSPAPSMTMDSKPVPDPTELTTAQVIRETSALREIIETRLDGYDKAITLLQAASDKVPSAGMVELEVIALKELANNQVSNNRILSDERFASLTKQIDVRFESVHTKFTERLNGMDKAIILHQTVLDKYPSDVDTALGHLRALVDAMFSKTDDQITAIKTLFDKTGELNNTALQAAFAAAKEAVGAAQTASALANTKMETTFTKNFEQVNQLITTIQESLGEKVEDLRKVFDDKIEDLKKQMQMVENRGQLDSGRQRGMGESWSILVSVAGILVSIVAVVVVVLFHH
jgi:hypothetical protein